MTTDIKQRSPEWYAARKGRVTGSIVGAILGLDPYKKRADILRQMVREAVGAPKEDENEFLERTIFGYGKVNEDNAILDFRMETGLDVEPCGFFPHDEWLGASPDGLTSDGGILECKAPWSRRDGQDREFKSLDDQPHYYAQMQIEMLCADCPHAWFFQWASHKCTAEKVLRDYDWLNQNLPILRQFYAEYLDAIKEPDEYLAPRRIVIDTPEAARMVREYDELSEAIELATERKKDLLASMVDMALGENAEFAGRKLTLTKKAGSISYAKAVKALCPDADLEKWRGKPQEYWGLK